MVSDTSHVPAPTARPAPGRAKDDPRPASSHARALTRHQKAAVIVQFLLSEGAALPLEDLPEDIQERLTTQIGTMRLVDRETLCTVVSEFVGEMEAIGLTFPDGLEGALGLLDGHISAATAARLRREAGIAARGDPFERLAACDTRRLIRFLEEESTEIGAVLLSKLKVPRAAELLGLLPGERARELSYAISRTARILPETVQRIGVALVAQVDAEPVPAFAEAPVRRVGEILNFSRAATRDDVLEGLKATDAAFAAEVRKAIFTFSDIPDRITPRDVPRIIRGVEQPRLVAALAFAASDPVLTPAAEFILGNISSRLAESLRDEIQEAGAIRRADGEAALTGILGEIRRLLDEGTLQLTGEDEDDG